MLRRYSLFVQLNNCHRKLMYLLPELWVIISVEHALILIDQQSQLVNLLVHLFRHQVLKM
jgi:hypothetical protein